jgi:TonB family protein
MAGSTAPARQPSSTSPVTRLASAGTSAGESDLAAAAINEVIPDVPARASRTIRGRVRVSVRVIVEPDGAVFAALADDRGPSRYFERLAIDAAKKWTFAPADTEDQRLMLIRFTFTRQGTTANATALR